MKRLLKSCHHNNVGLLEPVLLSIIRETEEAVADTFLLRIEAFIFTRTRNRQTKTLSFDASYVHLLAKQHATIKIRHSNTSSCNDEDSNQPEYRNLKSKTRNETCFASNRTMLRI